MSEGLFGFDTLTKFFIVDPEDNTLILWLQSCEKPNVAFPIIEPQIFYPMYDKKFINCDFTSLDMVDATQAKYYSIITIPKDLTLMTANLKAPILINQKTKQARQVVLQDSKLPINHPIYKSLKTHILGASSTQSATVKTEKVAETL